MTIYVWLDLETTGVDDKLCQIIELAIILTDDSLNVLDTYESIVNPGSVYYEPGALKMHKSSGLYDRVRTGAKISTVEDEALSLIKRYEPRKRRAYLAGNSIHFDRRYLSKYMPSIVDHLASRHLDVSAIGMWARSLFGKDIATYKAPRPHRALDDLRRSIEELSFYKKCFIENMHLLS